MEITLIRPPAYSVGIMGAQLVPFLGIAYIAAAAREAGHHVDIVDMCGEDITHTEIVRGRYVSYGMPICALKKRLAPSEVFGITSTFSQDWMFHKELIRHIRSLYPESLIVAGGEHISALWRYCLEDCFDLDICVIGEGEEIFVKLLEALNGAEDLSTVVGLAYRANNPKDILFTGRAERIRAIDTIPRPAWDLSPIDNYLSRQLNYHIQRGRTMPMLASRGCPYGCTFCSNANMWGSRWVARKPELIVDEMEYYIRQYRANNFVFSDLTAVVKKENILVLCNEILKRRLNITWQLPTLRTEAIDYDTLKLMYEAGCRDLDFAVESGSKTVLASVNKGNNPNKISLLIKDALKVGMNLSINIVIGLPVEGWKDFLKTYFLVMKLALNGLHEVNVFPFIPYPGSKLFEEFVKNGKLKVSDDYFLGLFGYADLGRALSWSEKFGPRTLSTLRLFLMTNFYSLMFISHPGRILRLIINSLRGRATSKLEGVLKRVFRNIIVSLSLSRS